MTGPASKPRRRILGLSFGLGLGTLAQAASAAKGRAPKPEGAGPDGLTTPQLARFLRALQSAVKSGSSAQVATLVSFPLRINLDAGQRRFIGPAQFVIEYATLFTPAVQAAVLRQKLTDIVRDTKGAQLGDGAVWVAALCDDLPCETSTPKVVAISPPVR
jgi:hypothetical protein